MISAFNFLKIIVDNIYLPLLEISANEKGYQIISPIIAEDFSTVNIKVNHQNEIKGDITFWIRTDLFLRYNELSYKSKNCDNYLHSIADGIEDDSIDQEKLKESFSKFFEKIQKLELDFEKEKNQDLVCIPIESSQIQNQIQTENLNEEICKPISQELGQELKTKNKFKEYEKICNQRYTKKEYHKILNKLVDLLVKRTSDFIAKNKSKLESGNVINLYQYFESQETENDLAYFQKIVKNTFLQNKLDPFLNKYGLKCSYGNRRVLIHSKSVKVNI